VFEIDFLQTSSTAKSADAITARFSVPGRLTPAVIVVDAGYSAAAEVIADHIATWYGTRHVDVVLSTHPDADHLNGIPALFPLLSVGELLIHEPRLHGHDGTDADCTAIHEVVAAAKAASVPVAEPFQGLTRLGGALTVVGPSRDYYEKLLNDQVGTTAVLKSVRHMLAEAASRGRQKVRSVVPWAPAETLVDDSGGTSARNNSSIVVSLSAEGYRALLTGDAGVPALTRACDYMDVIGISGLPLNLLQIPHHGSRHNLDGKLLDRILAMSTGGAHGVQGAVASASALDPAHPHPAVTNAVKRRSFSAYSNMRGHLCCPLSGPGRPWPVASEEPWLDEEEGAEAA